MIVITCVSNSFCRMKAPRKPVAPVSSILPLVNLLTFRFTALQNDRRVQSELKIS